MYWFNFLFNFLYLVGKIAYINYNDKKLDALYREK